MTTKQILVVGSTGKTGRRVADLLAAHGHHVRGASRSAAHRFDWEDPGTWADVVRGIDAAYLCFAPDLAIPGAADAVGAFARLAVDAGVRRLVLLSGRGEDGARLAEQAVMECGAEWTILRSAWFNQNFSEGPFAELVQAGEVALPAGAALEPFVDLDDVAEVAALALTNGGHAGRVYELTGPRSMTFAAAVREISTAADRAIAYVEISIDQFREGLAAQGVPEEVVELLTYLFTEVLDGRNASVTDGVAEALGRPARDFRDYARDAFGLTPATRTPGASDRGSAR